MTAWADVLLLDRRRIGLVGGIDPGLSKGSALALLRTDTGELVHAAIVNAPKDATSTLPWLEQPRALWDHVWYALTGERHQPGYEPRLRGHLRALAVELPQVYDRRKTGGHKIDPNDLVNLAALAGAWCATADEVTPSFLINLVQPAEWKGQVPKDVMERRLRAALSSAEVEIVERAASKSRQNDIWDAVGIARWAWSKGVR